MANIYQQDDRTIRDLLYAGIADVPNEASNLYRHENQYAITAENGFNPMSSHPNALVIGLGGIGTKIVNRIKQYLQNHVSEYWEHIGLLAIDTDWTEISRAQSLSSNETVCISVPREAQAKFGHIKSNRSELVKRWINPNFFVGFDNYSPSQIRQDGLAHLYSENKYGIYADAYIREKIREKATCLVPTTRPTTVYIVTGICGGTGSGIFNDVAMIAKDALGSRCEITGMVLLPDTIDQFASGHSNTIHANGYAALKELDYFVGIGQRAGYSETRLSTYGASEIYNHVNPLYQHVYLFSGAPTGIPVINRNLAAQDTAVSALITFLTNPTAFLRHEHPVSVVHNIQKQAIDPITGKENDGYYPEANFAYSAVGVANASIPEEFCTSYLIHKTLSSLYQEDTAAAADSVSVQRTDNIGKPSLTESAAHVKILSLFGISAGDGFSYGALIHTIFSKTKFRIDRDPRDLITREEVIANNHQILSVALQHSLIKQDAIDAVENCISDMFEQFRVRALAFIKEYGPQAFVDLYDGKGPDGVPFLNSPGLKNAIGLDRVTPPNPHAIDGSLTLESKLKQEADRRFPILGFHNPNITEYVRTYIYWQSALLYEETWNFAFGAADSDNAVTRLLIRPMEAFAASCRDLAVILREISNIYGNLTADFTRGGFIEAGNSFTEVNLIRDDASFAWVKNKLDSIVDHIDRTALTGEIVDDYFEHHPHEWTMTMERTEIVCHARQRFDAILAFHIRVANGGRDAAISVAEFMDHLAEKGAGYDAYANAIAPILAAKSQPMFNRDTALPSLNPTYQTFALIPESVLFSQNGAAIESALESALIHASCPAVQIIPTADPDRITFYTLESGHPLYVLKDLVTWEAAYNTANQFMLHRNESGMGDFDPKTGLEWKNYPHCRTNFDARQPDVPPERLDTDSMEYRFLISEFDANIQKALDYGILRREGDRQTGYYYNFYNIDAPDWDYGLAAYIEEEHHRPAMGAKLVDFLIRQNNDGALFSRRVELSNAPNFTAPFAFENDLDAERIPLDRAKRVIRANVKMYIELKRSVLRYEEIAASKSQNA